MARFVYLDHQATTPLDPRVFEAMRPWLDGRRFGNPHSVGHRAGWRAAEAVEEARAEVARFLGARPGEIVFTSGATEANNLALFGASGEGAAVIVSAIEHPSVLDCLPALAQRGRLTQVVGVGPDGRVDPGRLEAALPDGPALVSVMSANNETGVVQPIDAIARGCRDRGARLHCDAAQSLSTRALDVAAAGIDLLSLSGHKLYGPMGIGALFVRESIALTPQLHGGGQQHGLRPGTLPVALCVGLGAACRIAGEERDEDAERLGGLRERLLRALRAAVPELRENGGAASCLAGCLNVTLPGVDAEALLLDLPELALSTGSACATGTAGPSHVLRAMGRSDEEAHASLRFGLGRQTSQSDIDFAAERIAARLGARR